MRVGVIQTFAQKNKKLLSLAVAALFTASALAMTFSASAGSSFGFTQTELDNDWVTDRVYPSGGVTSSSFGGHENVAEIGIVVEDASELGSWYGYEGIKSVGDFGTEIEIDLYVPAEWQDVPVNAGFWASDGPVLTAYPIIAFRNSDTVSAGFYVYDTVTGDWIPSGVSVMYDDWNNLGMSLDITTDTVAYSINGIDAGSAYAGGDYFGQVFLNQYNYGAINDPAAVDYTVYWGGEEIVPELEYSVNGGGHILDGEGKRKTWNDISFGIDVMSYDTGVEGNATVRFHNVSNNDLDKTTFHAEEFTSFNYFEGNSNCESAMNFTATGTWNGEEGYTLIMRAGDNLDSVRFTLSGPSATYDSRNSGDFPTTPNCVGNARTELDKGNVTITKYE